MNSCKCYVTYEETDNGKKKEDGHAKACKQNCTTTGVTLFSQGLCRNWL